MTQGYLSARVKGYARKRRDEWRRRGTVQVPSFEGQANIAGWEELARITARGGLPVQRGGERLVQAAA